MKKLLLISILVSFCFKTSIAQITFQKTISIDGFCTHQTADGGYITNGYETDCDTTFCRNYGSLIKLNSLGDTVWTKKYSNDSIDISGKFSEQTNDGGFIIAGLTHKNYHGLIYNIYLMKVDSQQNISWTTFLLGGSSTGYCKEVHQTSDGGYIVVGYTSYYGAGQEDVYLIKINSLGTISWTKTYGGNYDDEGYSVKQTVDGGYIIIGITRSFGASPSGLYLIKTDSTGNHQWSKVYEGSNLEFANSVLQTQDGGYIFTGKTYGTTPANALLIKTDTTGNIIWSKKYGNTKNNVGYYVSPTNDNGFILSGYSTSRASASSKASISLIKTNGSGSYLWSKVYGDTTNVPINHYDVGLLVNQTTDGGYFISGRVTTANFPIPYVYLIKTDANGNSGCTDYNLSLTDSAASLSVSIPATLVLSGDSIFSIPIVSSNGNPVIITLCQSSTGIPSIKTSTSEISIFPNPFTSQTTITSSKCKVESVKVYDILGKEMRNYELGIKNEKSVILDMNGFSKGIYFVEAEVGKEIIRKKIIKQ